MICPWFDHKSSSKGMVFREQARVLIKSYSFTFISFQKIGLKEFFSLFRLSYLTDHFDSELKEQYIYIHYLNSSYLGDFWNNWIEKRAVQKAKNYFAANSLRFDLIHAQCLMDSGVFAYYLKQQLGIPYIITEHAQINMTGISVWRHKFLQSILNQAHKRLLVSHHKMAQYASNRLYGDFEVVGNMVNESLFYYKENKNSEASIFKIITVGAYSPIKDQGTLLKALRLLDRIQAFKPIEFHWAGYNGWVKGKDDEVQEQFNKLQLKNVQIKLSGTLNRSQMANAYQESDLFVFSSLAEGMPLAVMEALACGLPVVTTRWGGADEIIHQQNGRIVELRDCKEMSMQIRRVMENPGMFNHEEISSYALQKFGSKTFQIKMEEIYKSVLNG